MKNPMQFTILLGTICSSLLFASTEIEEYTGPIPKETLKGILEHTHANGWGSIYYDVLPQVIRNHNYKAVIEVGVALGGHAEFILKTTNVEKYYGIDPYVCYDTQDSFQIDVGKYSSLTPQENFNCLYEWVKNVRLKPFNERCNLIRDYSVHAASSFEDHSIDCIFIDGDHRYEAVINDLTAWYPKLKPGHLIMGDDYWQPSVALAVDRFFAAKGRQVFFFTSNTGYKIWAIYK